MSEYKEYTVRVYEDRTEWLVNGKRHREGAPAVEWQVGIRFWYLDGKRHRIDGPAVEWANGYKEWWIDGIELTEGEFYRRTNPPPCVGKVVEIEGRKYRLVAE